MNKFILGRVDREWDMTGGVLDAMSLDRNAHIFETENGYANGGVRLSLRQEREPTRNGQHLRVADMSLQGLHLLQMHELRNGPRGRLWHSRILFAHDRVPREGLAKLIERMREEVALCLFAFGQADARTRDAEANLVAGFMDNVLGPEAPAGRMRDVTPGAAAEIRAPEPEPENPRPMIE